ncbi:hypothetical protein ABVT39_023089 [Epinephelus coioides]
MAADRIARAFDYGRTRDRAAFREKTLRVNQDTLYYHTGADDQTCSLMYFSTRLIEWLDTLKQQYPELQETQQDGKIILQSKEGESTITLDPSVKVQVRGNVLMERFEEDFPQMAQAVRPGIASTGNRARPFTYPEDRKLNNNEKERHRKGILRDNEDTLFYDTKAGAKGNLIFFSKHVLKWLDEMERKYPTLQKKKQDNMIKLKNETQPGTIILHPEVKVVVEGKLMERFERDFTQPADLAAAMEGLTLNNEEEHSDESEGEGTLDTTQPTN